MDYLELWLIRHGETDSNKNRRIQGQVDVPLNDLGKEQAQKLAKRIGHMKFDKIYSSDLSRALLTAQSSFPNAEIVQDSRLREINLGNYEGRYYDQFSDEETAVVKVWFAGPFDQKVPGGESNDDLHKRAKDWLASLPKSGRVIAFSHGGFIASLLQTIVGRPEPIPDSREIPWSFRLGNTSISKIYFKENSTILSVVNDTAHLELNWD